MAGLLKRLYDNYIFWAFIGFLGFGITNTLIGIVNEKGDGIVSISGAIVLWVSSGVCGTILLIAFYILKGGLIGIPSKKYGFMACMAGIFLALGMLCLKLGMHAEPDAKGPIVSVVTCNSILVAVASYFILGEKLQKIQLAGMATAVSGLIIMQLINSDSQAVEAFLYGLGAMICFTITNFTLKYIGHNGTNSFSATVLVTGSCGVFGVGGFITTVITGNVMEDMDKDYYYVCCAFSGVFLTIGMLAIKLAVTKGVAGVSTAITGSNSILVFTLDVIILSTSVKWNKILGMFVATFGVVILAVGPFLMEKYGRKNQKLPTTMKEAEKEKLESDAEIATPRDHSNNEKNEENVDKQQQEQPQEKQQQQPLTPRDNENENENEKVNGNDDMKKTNTEIEDKQHEANMVKSEENVEVDETTADKDKDAVTVEEEEDTETNKHTQQTISEESNETETDEMNMNEGNTTKNEETTTEKTDDNDDLTKADKNVPIEEDTESSMSNKE
eukprot:TRINITY_DN773146_c0_g1_i1.p1 TRINITY_DN773146_c0_g1~~TRINITY_DN773146_c0_g1_i1.p1  ORF type:complete len:501 (-),score=188.15 TRINITY_DN773146_c0_g1_i1:107-1609(-)